MNRVNMGKHVPESRRNTGLLTYDQLTDESAAILGVAIPFLENWPLDIRHCGEQRENFSMSDHVSQEAAGAKAQRSHDHGFSQEDIWHEMRAIGGDERQAIRSLIEAEARLDD